MGFRVSEAMVDGVPFWAKGCALADTAAFV
jgi:hypothetical protein